MPESLQPYASTLASADERVLWAILAVTLLLFGYGAFVGWRARRGRGGGPPDDPPGCPGS